MKLEKEQLLICSGVLLTVMVVAILAFYGATEEGVRVIVRATARTSLAFFLLAFITSSIHCLSQNNTSAWLLRNRGYIGLSFALSHTVHLFALISLGIWFPDPFLQELKMVQLIVGGIGYLLIFAMTITTFAAPRRVIGEKAWRFLHKFGVYYIWIVFAQSYIRRAVDDSFYVPFALALILALVFRWGSYLARRFNKRSAVRTQVGL